MNGAATIAARATFRLVGVSDPKGYASARDGTFPLPPIWLGRKLVFARALVRALLGLTDDELDVLLDSAPRA